MVVRPESQDAQTLQASLIEHKANRQSGYFVCLFVFVFHDFVGFSNSSNILIS